MSEATLRWALVDAARATVARGLNHGSSGNLSVRAGTAFLITPTGMPCDGLTEDDLASVALADGRAMGRLAPSSERQLHRDLYLARPDLAAIVHAQAARLRTFSAQMTELRHRPLFYALSRRIWELREELDLLEGYPCSRIVTGLFISTGLRERLPGC